MVAHAFNSSNWRQRQVGSEFEASLVYKEKPRLKIIKIAKLTD